MSQKGLAITGNNIKYFYPETDQRFSYYILRGFGGPFGISVKHEYRHCSLMMVFSKFVQSDQ